MAVAEKYATPRSIVIGGPVPAPGEPLWLPEDLEWAVAYERFKASRCGGCGTHRDEWPDDPNAPDPYVTERDRCPGCHALAQEDEDIQNEGHDALAMRAVLVPGDAFEMAQDIRDAEVRLGLRRPRPQVG